MSAFTISPYRCRKYRQRFLNLKWAALELMLVWRVLLVLGVVFLFFKSQGHYGKSPVILCYTLPLLALVLLIELPDPNLGMGASGTQASGGAVVAKGTNKRRAA